MLHPFVENISHYSPGSALDLLKPNKSLLLEALPYKKERRTHGGFIFEYIDVNDQYVAPQHIISPSKNL